MTESAAYCLSGVTKDYRRGREVVRALRGIDLVIRRGEFVVIQGPSGSGKSTLLQILGALENPSGGTVLYESANLATLNDRALTELRARSMGFVFQGFNLLPTLTARENVEAALQVGPVRTQDHRQVTARLLDRVGLAHRYDHLPSQMSGGEQQRVAIARAVANDPAVILADEPTGNLDSSNGQAIMNLLISLNSDGSNRTLIVVTHNDKVASMANASIRIMDGVLAEA